MPLFIACLIGLVLNVGVGAESLVEGRVHLASGLPASGVQVRLFDLTDLRQSVGTTTDAVGYFALSLQALSGARGAALPVDFALGQNYPNPFNPSTLIPYQLPVAAHVRLEVFNMLGQRLVRLVDSERSAGAHTARWDGTDAAGRAVGAGVYIYRLSSGGMKVSRRMVLIDGQAGVSAGVSSRPPRPAQAAQDQTYGLVVWGPDMVAYVDPAFHVRDGMTPVDIVVEVRGLSGRPKVAAGGILGDVNGDGRVDIVDALFVAMYSVDPSTLAAHIPNISLGDVDADGDIDFTDAYLIGTYSVNPLDPTLPAGIGQALSDSVPQTPKEARSALNEQGIAYTLASFFERIRAGDVSAVRLFITAGMDINAQDDDGRTALSFAAQEDHVEVIRILVEQWVAEAGAQAREDDGRTALMYAAFGGDVEVVRFLLANGADIHAQDDDGRTALSFAAQEDHVEVIRILVEQWVAEAGAQAREDGGRTALMYAALGGDVEVVRFLLANGADIHAQEDGGRTALMYAALGGDVEVVRFLLANGADIHAQEDDGRTALMRAADEGGVEVVGLLLANGADIHAQDDSGRTALMSAARWGDVEVVGLLLANGADIHAQGDGGWTVLMYAAAADEGGVEVVRLLLANGADIHAQSDRDTTVLMSAALGGDVEVVGLLLANGADIHAQDDRGWTALLSAAWGGDVEVVGLLLANGADIHAQDDDGRTALMRAADEGGVEVVGLLLANGADIHAQDDSGRTALLYAARWGHVEIIRILVEQWVAEAGTDAQDDSGRTVLIWAAWWGDVEMVRFLLANGADIHAQDDSGRTALMYASGHQEVIDLLEAAGATE